MSTRQLDGITGAHYCGADRLCIHANQHGQTKCAVITRAQLEAAATGYEQPDRRHWTIIDGLWLSRTDVQELLIEGWGE